MFLKFLSHSQEKEYTPLQSISKTAGPRFVMSTVSQYTCLQEHFMNIQDGRTISGAQRVSNLLLAWKFWKRFSYTLIACFLSMLSVASESLECESLRTGLYSYKFGINLFGLTQLLTVFIAAWKVLFVPIVEALLRALQLECLCGFWYSWTISWCLLLPIKPTLYSFGKEWRLYKTHFEAKAFAALVRVTSGSII